MNQKTNYAAYGMSFLLAAVALPAVAAASPVISCASPEDWDDGARVVDVMSIGRGDDGSVIPPPVVEVSKRMETKEAAGIWSPVYKSTGVEGLPESEQKSILKYGVLWLVDPADLGVSQKRAIDALNKSGAAAARADSNGRVYFRALEKDRDRVAEKAARMLVPDIQLTDMKDDPKSPGAAKNSRKASEDLNSFSDSALVNVDTAFMRLEGRYSHSAVQFIESLPAGLSVMPFGTAFAIYIPSSQASIMWDALDNEGKRVLLVGASTDAKSGESLAQAVQYCGGTALLRRFPTPKVVSAANKSVIVEIEGQSVLALDGDVVLIMQDPPFGQGIEVGLMRISKN